MDISTGAIGSIISKLADLLKVEYKLQIGVKKQVESLTQELESAQEFLQKIDTMPPDQLDMQVKSWANEVREASYDMEDILDTFLVSVKGPETVDKNKLQRIQKKMRSLFISKTKARHNIANAIEEVKDKLKEIDERHRRYKLHKLVVSPATPSLRVDPRIARVHGINASLLVGINERKDAVVKMLSPRNDDMSANKRKVVSLLGSGGVGKTTLAKATYDQLQQEYQCAVFVSVGQRPDVVKVLKHILLYLEKDKLQKVNSTQVGEDVLIPELLDFLRDKRYLIVIDDLWETQSRKTIIEALTENNIGSRIIITTRKDEVAIGEVYRVQPLTDDNSKKLFYTRIFDGEDKCPDNHRYEVFEAAHKILKKCGGVPLAIITMASLLVGKSMEEWLKVCNSIGFRDKDKKEIGDTMWILSLSYHDLPAHLRTCLLYLSMFPEDYLIRKDTLIWMWICEGFVSGKPGCWLFEIGEGYFNDLINRSLIQPVEEEKSKIIKRCCVHDMVLDLIRSLASEANFAMVSNNGENMSFGSNPRPRRLALNDIVVEDIPEDNHIDKGRVRAFIACRCTFGSSSRFLDQRFKFLRVLNLEDCDYNYTNLNDYLADFDEHVENLLHLRFLGIYTKGSYKCSIPSRNMPSSMGMLKQLVCLRAIGMVLPGGVIMHLTSLQELHINPGVDDMSRRQFVKDLGILRELKVLRINLTITNRRLQKIHYLRDALGKRKKILEILTKKRNIWPFIR